MNDADSEVMERLLEREGVADFSLRLEFVGTISNRARNLEKE
jgi:hypothetical protein